MNPLHSCQYPFLSGKVSDTMANVHVPVDESVQVWAAGTPKSSWTLQQLQTQEPVCAIYSSWHETRWFSDEVNVLLK